MNISTKLKGLFSACVVAVGMTAVADPSVTINKVESVKPWDSTKGAITVDYSLAGLTAGGWYKVAFDITAGGKTASVTNAADPLDDGSQAQKVIETAKLFGDEVVDTKAKVKVTLIAVKPPQAGQLWKDGPIWAECNVGATVPGDYGKYYTFKDNQAANAAASLGDGWRLPTDVEFQGLIENCDQRWMYYKDSEGVKRWGCLFTGRGDYSTKGIFLPAAGYWDNEEQLPEEYWNFGDGHYWSSVPYGDCEEALFLTIHQQYGGFVDYVADDSSNSVRAVRDAK